MKKYVVQFANDQLKPLEKALHLDSIRETYGRIERTVRMCERGFITDFEAIREIVRVIEKEA